MDKYHIYEEIGKGEFSQVFKGREKKKIEYVAIKRVEKSMMSKVVINSSPSVILCTLTIDSKS
jgi:serine/threonine-protein kinase ULK4